MNISLFSLSLFFFTKWNDVWIIIIWMKNSRPCRVAFHIQNVGSVNRWYDSKRRCSLQCIRWLYFPKYKHKHKKLKREPVHLCSWLPVVRWDPNDRWSKRIDDAVAHRTTATAPRSFCCPNTWSETLIENASQISTTKKNLVLQKKKIAFLKFRLSLPTRRLSMYQRSLLSFDSSRRRFVRCWMSSLAYQECWETRRVRRVGSVAACRRRSTRDRSCSDE